MRAQLTEADLQRAFQMFGVVMEVKIYRKGSYGFVQFERHEDAVRAIVNMNGGNLGGRALKCSWGRHQVRLLQHAPFPKSRPCKSLKCVCLNLRPATSQLTD